MKPLARKREEPARILQERMRTDDAVNQIVRATLSKHGCASVMDLGRRQPKTFDELAEFVEDFLSQAPTEEKFGWMR